MTSSAAGSALLAAGHTAIAARLGDVILSTIRR
jgi:hypothetical protein